MTTIRSHNPVTYGFRLGAGIAVASIALWFAYISAGTKWITERLLDFAARIGP